MLESKGCPTFMSSTEKLVKEKGAAFETSLYRSIVRSLQYVTLASLKLPSQLISLVSFLLHLLCIIGKPANVCCVISNAQLIMDCNFITQGHSQPFQMQTGDQIQMTKISGWLLCLPRQQSCVMVIKKTAHSFQKHNRV